MITTDKIENILDLCNMASVSGPDVDCKMGYSGACNFLIRVAPQYNSIEDFKAFIIENGKEIVNTYGKDSDYIRGYLKAYKDVLNLFK